MLSPAIAEDGTLAWQRGVAPWRRRPQTELPNESGEFSSSDEGPLGLESESESEDLEMNDYPNMPEGTASKRGRANSRNTKGLSLRGGEGPSLGDRLIMADGDRPVVSREEKKIADVKVIRSLAINVLLIGLWYISQPTKASHC